MPAKNTEPKPELTPAQLQDAAAASTVYNAELEAARIDYRDESRRAREKRDARIAEAERTYNAAMLRILGWDE